MNESNETYRFNPRADCFTSEARHLLKVRCEYCDQLASCDAAFPLLNASDFPDWTWKLTPRKLSPVISWTEFVANVIERARMIYNDPALELLPGSALGPIDIEPIGMWPKTLDDINIASPGGPLFSRSLIERLQERGICLPFQPVMLQNRKGFSHPYGIMQPTVYRNVVHPETFIRTPHLRCCDYCEEIKVLNPWLKPPRQIFLRAEFRGKTDDLFRVTGFYGRSVFLSDRLKSVLEDISPTGLNLDPFGIWFDAAATEHPEPATEL
jgi:hypothetical protein